MKFTSVQMQHMLTYFTTTIKLIYPTRLNYQILTNNDLIRKEILLVIGPVLLQ
jgi:hypothetical protein